MSPATLETTALIFFGELLGLFVIPPVVHMLTTL